MKEYSTFPKAPRQESHHQIQFTVIPRTLVDVRGGVLLSCKGEVGIDYSPSLLSIDLFYIFYQKPTLCLGGRSKYPASIGLTQNFETEIFEVDLYATIYGMLLKGYECFLNLFIKIRKFIYQNKTK